VTAVQQLTPTLRALADSTAAILYPVEADPEVAAAYAAWNSSYCSPEAANEVVETIRHEIISPTLKAHPGIRYVVLVGDDGQIPFYRQVDRAAISNEREFSAHAEANVGALWAATDGGFYLTDDAYGTPAGQELAWRGSYFWRPFFATGRLVETPEEMAGMINGFLLDQTLEADDALVTGYDFLTDAAEAISRTLTLQLGTGTVETLIGQSWTASDLQAAWPKRTPDAPDLVSVNAHFEHWRALPADVTTEFYNTDIVSGSAPLSGTLAWSMGCHAGYNVPDEDVLDPQTSPDFPQALARRQATWIANTGYGYGMDDSIAGSERVMLFFTEALDNASAVPVGMALRDAKLRYLRSLPAGGLTAYDAKSVMETTLYGLPMYRVSVPYTQPHRAQQSSSAHQELLESNSSGGLHVESWQLAPTFEEHQGRDGLFFTVDGAPPHAAPGRPLLPVATYELPDIPGKQPHGALLISATLTSFPDFNPVVGRPVTDTTRPEPALNSHLGWVPGRLLVVNRAAYEPHLVATHALFNARTRELRRLDRALVRVFHAPDSNTDFTPPSITAVSGTGEGETVTFNAEVEDLESNVIRVYVTLLREGAIRSHPLWADNDDATGKTWTGTFRKETLGWPTRGYFIQAVDSAGNVATVAGKGDYHTIQEEYDLYLPLILRK
jgi:hypothetical protein